LGFPTNLTIELDFES